MRGTLEENSKVVAVEGYNAAGTTDITPSAGVDTAGYGGCMFIFHFGAITASAVTSCKVQQSSDAGVADSYADLEDSGVDVADTDDDKVVVIDIKRPRERYLLPIVDRGTANAVLNGIVAVLYGGSGRPDAQSEAAGAESHASPAEGTA